MSKQFFALLSISASLLLFTSLESRAQEDAYKTIFEAVDRGRLIDVLKDMTGYNPVVLNGQSTRITERITTKGKAKFRAYFKNYFESLGMQVNALDYNTHHFYRIFDDHLGHNMEAVLPGKSADSIVIIVHYDSMGSIPFFTRENPAVDDDMTGMSIMMETARILATQYAGRLKYTIRFVAADYEEWILPSLEGSRRYARYINALSEKEGFKLVAGIDDEQSGWNCAKENRCGDNLGGKTFDVFSCSPDHKHSYPEIGQALVNTALLYSDLQPFTACDGDDSDQFSLWEIGIPTVELSEHNPGMSPHNDRGGSDTLDTIDQDYYYKIAQIAVTFAAQTAQVDQ